MKHSKAAVLIISLVLTIPLFAQTYRCDWWVSGSGGAEITDGTYRVSTTAGQSAIGRLSSANLFALIGFWQSDIGVGIMEKEGGFNPQPLTTRLERVAPNPFRLPVRISYSLAQRKNVRLELFDLSGRLLMRFVSSAQAPGRYSLLWNGRDKSGRQVSAGVYFLRFVAGEHREVTKLILER